MGKRWKHGGRGGRIEREGGRKKLGRAKQQGRRRKYEWGGMGIRNEKRRRKGKRSI